MSVGSIFRYVIAFIDSGVVWLLKTMSSLFNQLTDVMLYSEDMIQSLSQRIGLVLGIFMLFRLAISLITYLISPDKMSDSSKGGGKLLLNVVVSLVLLATINIIFVQAYKIQNAFISSNFIEKIFFGAQGNMPNADVSYYLYTPLFAPNTDVLGEECKNLWSTSTDAMGECSNILDQALGTDKRAVYQSINNQDMSIVLQNWSVVTAKYNGDYVFVYRLVAPIVGIAASIILISFCMDLAVRAVKLLFLQIVAPIPIISNIDPNKGQDIFKKWYQECFKTFLSVFIRLLSIDFAIFLITMLLTEFADIFTPYPLLNVILIIGCLMFAKQVPKLIEDMFGIKLEGGMILNPLKKFQEQALFGNQIVGASRGLAAGALGVASGAAGAAVASHGLGNKWWQTAGATVRGAGRGLFGGIGAGYKAKNGFQAVHAGVGRFATNAAYVNSLDGTTLGGRLRAGLQQRMNLATDADLTKKDLETLGSFEQASDAALKRGEAEMIKYNSLALRDDDDNVIMTMEQFKAEQQRLEIMKNSGVNRDDDRYWSTDGRGHRTTFNQAMYDRDVENYSRQLAALQDQHAINQKNFAAQYVTDVAAHKLTDARGALVVDGQLDNILNQVEYYQGRLAANGHVYSVKDATGQFNGGMIKKAKEDAYVDKQRIETEHDARGVNLYAQQQANAAATKPRNRS